MLNVIACKYIVSTLKAFNLYSKYINEDERGKSNILWMIQKVISGIKSLEEVLEELDVTYDIRNCYGIINSCNVCNSQKCDFPKKKVINQ